MLGTLFAPPWPNATKEERMKITLPRLTKQETTIQSTSDDLGLFLLRFTAGGLMAGHGAQKLFGSFGGHGIKGTAGFLESLGLKPGEQWAAVAGASELSSGLLTMLGLLHPIGPLAMFGPMIMAWATSHAGKPIWVTSGGAELPLMYLNNALALAFTGPGRFSLDKALGIKVPTWLVALSALGVAAGVTAGLLSREQPAGAQTEATDDERTTHATASIQEQPEPAEQPNTIVSEHTEQLHEREVGAG
jgi:putative oxidoreductase